MENMCLLLVKIPYYTSKKLEKCQNESRIFWFSDIELYIKRKCTNPYKPQREVNDHRHIVIRDRFVQQIPSQKSFWAILLQKPPILRYIPNIWINCRQHCQNYPYVVPKLDIKRKQNYNYNVILRQGANKNSYNCKEIFHNIIASILAQVCFVVFH